MLSPKTVPFGFSVYSSRFVLLISAEFFLLLLFACWTNDFIFSVHFLIGFHRIFHSFGSFLPCLWLLLVFAIAFLSFQKWATAKEHVKKAAPPQLKVKYLVYFVIVSCNVRSTEIAASAIECVCAIYWPCKRLFIFMLCVRATISPLLFLRQ